MRKQVKNMRKRLVRVAVVTSLLVTIALSAVGCKKVECDICGEKKSGKVTEVFGEEIAICNDCQKDLEELGNLFK